MNQVNPYSEPSSSSLEALGLARGQAEEAQRESEEKFRSIFDQSPMGIEIYDAQGRLVDINKAALEIFGIPNADEVRGFDIFSDPNVTAEIRAKLATGEAVVFEMVFDFDLVTQLNLYKTSKAGKSNLDCLVTPLKSAAGNITGYLVHVRDVTHRRKMAQIIEHSEKRFRALIEHSSDAISLIDAQAHVVYESPSVRLLTGYSPEERIGKSGLELIYQDDLPYIQSIMMRVLSHPGWIECAEFRSVRKDGTIWWTEGTAINLLDEPSVQAVVINYRDVTDRKKAEKALREANKELNARVNEIEKLQNDLREQALRDPLTGLYNRRHLADAMQRELARMQRERRSMSVIVIDIDRFKKINDNHGHQIGDRFLVQISNLIASHARSSDIACRYGGEEFLLVMPGATLRTALKRAEAIRAECAAIRIPDGNKQLKVTLSIGVATYPKHGTGAEEIVIKADKALYKAKRAGRNCVRVWE